MRLGTLARLFGWLSHVLDDRERLIFGFWDGRRWRRVDPLPVLRALDADPEFNTSRDPGLIDRGDEEARGRALSAVKRAFGVEAFDGQKGLTETELLLLLVEFWDFCADLKKKASHLPTSQPSTEPAPSVESTTVCEWDCGCASTENLPAPATP